MGSADKLDRAVTVAALHGLGNFVCANLPDKLESGEAVRVARSYDTGQWSGSHRACTRLHSGYEESGMDRVWARDSTCDSSGNDICNDSGSGTRCNANWNAPLK